jgi:DNA-binding response OmpR family regulator
MRLKLEKFAFRTERSATAEGAACWLETHHPDLIVTDIMLPMTDGWKSAD